MTNIQSAIQILKKATRLVKIAPFVFALVFICSMLCYLFADEFLSGLVDMLFYASPLLVVFILRLSSIFKMCIWHKIECMLPLIPIVSVLLDGYICEFEWLATYINWIVIVSVFVMSLVNAYFVFIKRSSDGDEESNS